MRGGGLQSPLMVEVGPRETRRGGESVKVLEDGGRILDCAWGKGFSAPPRYPRNGTPSPRGEGYRTHGTRPREGDHCGAETLSPPQNRRGFRDHGPGLFRGREALQRSRRTGQSARERQLRPRMARRGCSTCSVSCERRRPALHAERVITSSA